MTDIETYEKVAQEALLSTRDAWVHWRDPAIGKTVAVGMGGELSDPLAISNLEAALTLLDEHVQSGDVEESTVGRSGRTWLRTLAFRIYDDEGNITQAWKDAVDKVFLPMQDYPLLDEDDYYERVHTIFADEMEFIYGAAADTMISALCEAGISSLEEYDEDKAIVALDAWVEAGNTLTDAEQSAVAEVVRRYVARHDYSIGTIRTLGTLLAYGKEPS